MTADELMRALAKKHPAMRGERVTLTQGALRSLVRLAWTEGRKSAGDGAVVDAFRDAFGDVFNMGGRK